MKKTKYFADKLKTHFGLTTPKSFLTYLYNYPLQFTDLSLGQHLLTEPLPLQVFKDNLILIPEDLYGRRILLIPSSLCYQEILEAHPNFPSYGELLGGTSHIISSISKHSSPNRLSGYTFSGVSFSIECLRDQFKDMNEGHHE